MCYSCCACFLKAQEELSQDSGHNNGMNKMMNLILLFTAITVSSQIENDVIKYFKAADKSLATDTFAHYVSVMAEEMSKNNCEKCTVEYLRALSRMSSSADEVLTDDLGKIIAKFPSAINRACIKLSKPQRTILALGFLPLAIENASIIAKSSKEKIKLDLSKCLIRD